jgi:hypothetical protein
MATSNNNYVYQPSLNAVTTTGAGVSTNSANAGAEPQGWVERWVLLCPKGPTATVSLDVRMANGTWVSVASGSPSGAADLVLSWTGVADAARANCTSYSSGNVTAEVWGNG